MCLLLAYYTVRDALLGYGITTRSLTQNVCTPRMRTTPRIYMIFFIADRCLRNVYYLFLERCTTNIVDTRVHRG